MWSSPNNPLRFFIKLMFSEAGTLSVCTYVNSTSTMSQTLSSDELNKCFMEVDIGCSSGSLSKPVKQIEPLSINPILTGGGHYGLYDRRSSAVSLWIALRSPNFLTLFLSTFYKRQKSRFQKKTLSKIFMGGTLLCKNQNLKKKILSFGKHYFFCLNINCT